MTKSRHTPIVLHVPHSSPAISASVREQLLLDDGELAHELLVMTDWFTDELFDARAIDGTPVVYPVSRLVVDPERFPDDADEPMAARGMGAIYSRTSGGLPLRRPPSAGERRRMMDEHYWPHHRRLTSVVDSALAEHGRCLILDCHSFPTRPLPYELDQREDRPEICLGTDAFHTPSALAERAAASFRARGFDVALNRPFAGSLVPGEHYNKDARVASLMVELRRDLYMDETSGARSTRFASIQNAVCEVAREIAL